MRDQDKGTLMARADAAIREASQLRAELDRQRAIADAICRHARRCKTFELGLAPALAISLIVEETEAAQSLTVPARKTALF